MRPVVLAIAGSDSGGGAGIQADLRAIEGHGGFPTTAISAVTAQNSVAVRSIHAVPTEILRDQIQAVLDDFPVAAIKTGMLPNRAALREVARAAESLPSAPLVVDPVLVATSGAKLSPVELAQVWIEELGPFAALWTPNAEEASALSGLPVEDLDGAEAAAQAMLAAGARSVLVTGGHIPEEGDGLGRTVDTWSSAERTLRIDGPRVSGGTHGSGCSLASGIATRLALGDDMERALRVCKRWIAGAIERSVQPGAGEGAVDGLWRLRGGADAEPV